tara:strand:- start:286 stop:444 length:159 start_codon:yes stop_codon:yes gene_type:complete
MNHKLPKNGALDGVLTCTPSPLPHNAGMPRGAPLGYSSMEEYYKAQRRDEEE